MASSTPIPCGPCYKGNINIEADIWCYNCVEGLCSMCLSHHERSNGTYDHKTTDVTSYKPSIPAFKTECDKHYEQFNLYCTNHLMPCCDDCISTSHSKCTGIKSLTSVVQKTNIEKSKESVETDISSMLKFLDKLVNTKSKNIKTGEHTYLGIKKSVKQIRKEINKHLDHMEKKLCQETDTTWKKEKSKASDFISEIEGKREKLKVIRENIYKINENKTSKLQSFLGVNQIEQQVQQFQRYINDLENDERAKAVDFTMKLNDEIESILGKLESIKSLGEIMILKTDIDLNIDRVSREQYNINSMTMHIRKNIKTNIGLFISDMICLMDGRLIVVNKDKINLLTADGKFEKHLPIPGKAWNVTQIDNAMIAISYPSEKVIKIFNMKKETVTKVIKLDKTSLGLSFFNNSLAVGSKGQSCGEIDIIDLEGNFLKSIQVESGLYNLVYYNDRIIYIDSIGKAVTCIDGSGKQIWQYTEDLSEPAGLCADTYGNIIVAEWKSKKIIVVSKDGVDSKVLIDETDGLENPSKICLWNNESSGFICNSSGTYLAKLDLSYV